MTQREIITAFYTAFAAGDAAAMTKLYHPEIEFEDPAFGKLKGEKAAMMWKMLIGSAQGNLHIQFQDVTDNSATWIAHYPFGPKKRKVINHIQATFECKDGLIIKHTDKFNLHKWASQALGFSGWLLGGTGFFKKKLQQKTQAQLDKYIKSAIVE